MASKNDCVFCTWGWPVEAETYSDVRRSCNWGHPQNKLKEVINKSALEGNCIWYASCVVTDCQATSALMVMQRLVKSKCGNRAATDCNSDAFESSGCFNTKFENTSSKEKQTPWPESASELYTPSGRRLSAKLVLTFAGRGRRVVSVTDSYGHILGFLDRSRYFSIK
jgi:hypothetical protein